MVVCNFVYGAVWRFFVGCQSIVLVGVSVVLCFVDMMEAGVVDCMMVLHPTQGLLVLCFDVVSYKFGVEICLLLVLLCKGSWTCRMYSMFVSDLVKWLFVYLVVV